MRLFRKGMEAVEQGKENEWRGEKGARMTNQKSRNGNSRLGFVEQEVDLAGDKVSASEYKE
jgi:hypothetical protein